MRQQSTMTTKPTPERKMLAPAFERTNAKACSRRLGTIPVPFAIWYGIALYLAMFICTGQQTASAQGLTPVDISAQANFTWVSQPQTDPNGKMGIYFPGGPVGLVTLGGVPFNLKSNGAGYQAWNAHVAAGGGGGQQTITIPVGQFGVTDVYTLINTYWGLSGPGCAAWLIFTGSGGATYTNYLIGGSDIRGWCCGNAGGTIDGTNTINAYTSPTPSEINGTYGVLDLQHITLPAAFGSQVLTSIQLVDNGSPGVQRVILDGVTVNAIGAPLMSIRISEVEVCWTSVTNATYRVEYRSDLTTNTWVTLTNCVAGADSETCIYDKVLRGMPQRFYRVVVTNCLPGL
jgi:hypothetical protein